MISTNVLLYKVKDISDRYQEGKYVGMASILMFEILIVGIPVFISVSGNSVAVFAVLASFIALADIGMCTCLEECGKLLDDCIFSQFFIATGILCCIFVPKMMYVEQGLAEGITVGESILKKSMKKAATRESIHSTFTGMPVSHVSPRDAAPVSRLSTRVSFTTQKSFNSNSGPALHNNLSLDSSVKESILEDSRENESSSQEPPFGSTVTDSKNEEGQA